jgi:hypothetical protein
MGGSCLVDLFAKKITSENKAKIQILRTVRKANPANPR